MKTANRLNRRGRKANGYSALESLEQRKMLSVNLAEAEPNDTAANANVIQRTPDTHVIASGRVNTLGDRDWFRIALRQGDVFGAALTGNSGLNTSIRLVNAAGELMIGNDDCGFFGEYLPPESPLPHVTSSASDSEIYYVISQPGTYFIEVSASADGSTGQYNLDTLVARPGLEKQATGTRQILFLDFDGAKVGFSEFGDRLTTGAAVLSPLASFLSTWGLTAADENAVVDLVLSSVTEKLSTHVRVNGLNASFGIDIRNSRDHADEFGSNPFVSRVVVGGTFVEAGLPRGIGGISQDIDVGNFKTDDQGVAILSWITDGVNLVPIKRPATKIEFIADAIASVVAHEAGHFFGCFHTDQPDFFVGTPSLMDPAVQSSLGPDFTFGTKDDINLKLVADSYSLTEPFRGLNDTLNTVAFGLTTGMGAATKSATFSEFRIGTSRSPLGTASPHSAFAVDSLTGEDDELELL